MFPTPFEYVKAQSWAEAVGYLHEYGEEARPLAGGQSLVPMMMMQMAEPAFLVDVSHAASRDITETEGAVVISALARHREVAGSELVRARFPALAEAAQSIGNIRVRSRGTIGGSLAHSDAAAELPVAAVALNAQVSVLGPDGERVVDAGDLFVGHFETSLAPDEVITDITFALPAARTGSAFAEFTRRPGDYAAVEAAASVCLNGGSLDGARLVLGAIADRPIDVSEYLAGAAATADGIRTATRTVAGEVPIGHSEHGSTVYLRELVQVVAEDALTAALHRATEEPHR
ncbi:FAD binding domain-containing protein [Mycolicibacterium sp.]|uniref:FAD binding domain-containing protein n=1 Tax=Mycolicibacterium sp. TaxID=2320850 RepID=UPI003D12FDE5